MQKESNTRTATRHAPTRRLPSGRMSKRIGNTEYQVSYHFSQKSTESLNDKIVRLLKNEV